MLPITSSPVYNCLVNLVLRVLLMWATQNGDQCTRDQFSLFYCRDYCFINVLTWLRLPTTGLQSFHTQHYFFSACQSSDVFSKLLRSNWNIDKEF